MKIETASAVMLRVNEDPSALALHHHFQKFYMANRDKFPTDEQYAAATRYVSKLTAIKFTQENVVSILGLYPQTRILLAIMGPDEGSVHESLQFAVSHFLLSCRWPVADDGLDVHDFTSLLRRRAVEMGLNTLQGMNEFTSSEPVVEESLNPEQMVDVDFGERGDQAREFNLYIPPKKPSLLGQMIAKMRGMLKSKRPSQLVGKLRGKFAGRFVSKLDSKPVNDRLDPSV